MINRYTILICILALLLPLVLQAEDNNWKTAANERIEKYRKGDISITVLDNFGKPKKGARVHIKMKKHAFLFGTVLNAKVYMGKDKWGDYIRRSVKELRFNAVTQTIFWNDIWNESYKRLQKKANLQYKQDGFQVRGHTVIYPRWSNTPEEIEKLSKTMAEKAVSDHIKETAIRMNGWYTDWDLVNEMYGHMEWINSMGGMDTITQWHSLAKEKSPDTKIYYNHNGMISSTKNHGFREALYKMIKHMKEQGLIDGIGIEGHLDEDSPAPDQIYTYLDRYSELDLPIRITEFDLGTKDRKKHAQQFRDYLITFFSHPNIVGITLWGFTDGRMFEKRNGLVTPEGQLLPAGKVWKELVTKEWWTDVSGITDNKGKFNVRGFLGEYEVTVSSVGRSKTKAISLTDKGSEITIHM